jgi:hypothetical protein
MNNLPALPKFDFQAFFRDLPENLQQPGALAALASLGFHGLFFATLPVMTSSDAEANPERITPIITLTPEEQARLPNQMMPQQPGGMPIGKPNTTLPPMSGLGLPPLPSITPAPPPNNPSSGYDFGKGSSFFDPLPSNGSSSRTTDYSNLFPTITRSTTTSKVDNTTKVPAPKDPPTEPEPVDANNKYQKPPDDANGAPPPVLPPGTPAAPTQTPEQIAALNKQRTEQLMADNANLQYVARAPIVDLGSPGGGAGFTKSYGDWLGTYITAKLPQNLTEDQKKDKGNEIAGQIDYQQIKPPATLPPLPVAAQIGPNAKPIIVRLMIVDDKIDGPMLVSSTGDLHLDKAVGVGLKPYVEALIKEGKLVKSDNPEKPYRNYEFSLPLVPQAPVPPAEKPAA